MSDFFERIKGESIFDGITIPSGKLSGIHAPGASVTVPGTGQGFISTWLHITEPLFMEKEPVWHDFDQICYFAGGGGQHMDELGGVVEFWLGDEKGNLEKLVITKPMAIFIKAGMVHCPLNFIEVFDPKKPIFFQDMTFAGVYRRFRPGSDIALNEKFEPIEKTW